LDPDESLEQLLRRARRRRAPPDADAERVRRTVQAEWLAVSGRRRRNRRLALFATAATVLFAFSGIMYLLRAPGAVPVAVATIERSTGSLYLLGDQSELRETDELSVLTAGQTVVTGPRSGAAMNWHQGGQLRVDADTRIELLAKDAIFLRSGRVYFDSKSSLLSEETGRGEATRFLVRTDQGIVSHAGTQFMTERTGRNLTVSVREGEVRVDGDYHDARANAGQELTLEGRNRPMLMSISIYGEAWAWVEATAPAARVENPTIYRFLTWVARESGLGLRFATPAVEQAARNDHLIGRIDATPTEALRLWMSTVDLHWRIEDGVIVVSKE
jgi:hypothetical protein